MGQKQKQVLEPSPDNETSKRRRVAFTGIGYEDVGVEAKDCIRIFLVSSKEEFEDPEGFVINPVDLNSYFDNDGKIFGYEGLKINIWISSISFYAYADIVFESLSDRGKGVTDLHEALQSIFAETLLKSKDEFLQKYLTDNNFVRTNILNGEVLKQKAFKQADSDASNVEVVRLVAGNMPTGQLYCHIIPLVLLLVDGSSPIDVTDPQWELYVMVQKKTDQLGEIQCLLLGFTAVYRFYHYRGNSRLRLGQILVLPLYQHKGYGRFLIEVLNDVAISENVYDLTVEEPLDNFQHVRSCIDTQRLLSFEPIQPLVTKAVSFLKGGRLSKKTHSPRLTPPPSDVEEVRKTLKITKTQFLKCWEVLIYIGLNPTNKYMDNFVSVISERVKYDILGKDSGTSGKQLIEIPSDDNPEASFVMFKSGAGEDIITAQMDDDNQKNQEQQLQKLVQDRVKEIQLIAKKVTSHLESSEVADK